MVTAPLNKIVVEQQDITIEQLEYYSAQDIIAVDCEMMGLNVHRDRLCLVQIGDATGDRMTLVQVHQGQKEAPNLKKLLESNNLTLFHFARTDVAVLKYWLNISVNNIFCTKIGSKIARTYTDKHSLKELTKEVIGKDISKTQQSSDWGTPVLSRDQIQYAATDVYHLAKLYDKLRVMLERSGRYELAKSCANFLPTLCELDNLGYQNLLEH